MFTAPTDTTELLYGDLNYARAWVGGAFWTEFGASASHSRDGDGPPILAPVSEVERIYGRVTVPVLRARTQSLWTHLAFDVRGTELYDPLGPDNDEVTSIVRGSANYNVTVGDTRGDAMIELAHGLDVFGASQNGDPALTRADARPQFTKVRLDATVQHKFSDRWEFALMAAGQLADGALVAAEEFGGGGARFGRAYDYSEIVGDDGVAGAPNCGGIGAMRLTRSRTCSSTPTSTPCASGTSAPTRSKTTTRASAQPAAASASRPSPAFSPPSKSQNPGHAT